MTTNTLQDVFEDQLKGLLEAEKALIEVLPMMARVASEPIRKQFIEEQLRAICDHLDRMDEILFLDTPSRQAPGHRPGRTSRHDCLRSFAEVVGLNESIDQLKLLLPGKIAPAEPCCLAEKQPRNRRTGSAAA